MSKSPSSINNDSNSNVSKSNTNESINLKGGKSKRKRKDGNATSICDSLSPTNENLSTLKNNNDALVMGKYVKETYDYLEKYKPLNDAAFGKFLCLSEGQGLGKWFPSAKRIKNSLHDLKKETTMKSEILDRCDDIDRKHTKESCSLLLFYQYVSPTWPKEKVTQLINVLTHVGQTRGIRGRIRVSTEGVNSTISCIGPSLHSNNDFTNSNDVDDGQLLKKTESHGCVNLRYFAEDLRRFDPQAFESTDFKYIDFLPIDRHFKDLKILPVKELVFYGINGDLEAPLSKGGIHLPPRQYHSKLSDKKCVVIDIRNHYEAAIGRFDGQSNKTQLIQKNKERSKKDASSCGAEYIDPKMRKSTDFPLWLQKKETQEKLKGKEILMYCTGGVRCERASAYLKNTLGSKVGQVFQLEGGIEKYLQEFPEGGFWRGKNFVFDKREAISASNPEGVGGVVKHEKLRKNDKQNSNTSKVKLGHCCVCNEPWDRYLGKKKCYTCGVPVLLCDKCLTKKVDKIKGMELSVRCPLCVDQNVTVPAREIDYTENGIKNCMSEARRCQSTEKHLLKAAPSVLKWGGGHATQKKMFRKMKRKLCRYGSDCNRKDCMFAHPSSI